MLVSTCAILPCHDMDRTVAFYEAIGFTLTGRWEGSGYLIFVKDKVEIHFANDPNQVPATSDHAAYMRTGAVDAWSDELVRLDVWNDVFPRMTPAEDKDWEMREMHILDPDGNLLRVGQFM